MRVSELVARLEQADPDAPVYYLPFPESPAFEEVETAGVVRGSEDHPILDFDGSPLPIGAVLLFPP